MSDQKFKKGYKKYPRKEVKGKDFPVKETPKFGDNDISWWTMSDQLLNDVARLPFGRALGNAQSIGLLRPYFAGGSFAIKGFNDPAVIPGIAVINYRHAFGISGDAASPINVAARAIYSYVRHANSGHTNYESPDLMIYLFAVAEIYAGIAYLTKVYGTTQFWSQRNRYYGDRLISALGFDPVDVRENLADLRAQINLLSVKANSLVAPKDLPLFARRYFLPTHIYKDQDNEKAQLYTFKPVALGRFSGTKANTGSCLIPVATPWVTYGTCKVADATKFISDMLDEMLAEEDLGIMGGDILKAYKENGIHQLLSIPDQYACVPVYSEEMLQQIHNMNIGAYNQPVAETDWSITTITINADNDALRWNGGTGLLAQNNGYLLSEYCVRNYVASFSVFDVNTSVTPNTVAINGWNMPLPKVSECVIDTHLDDPAPADVMIATRLAFDITDTTYSWAGANHYILRSCGLEVVTTIEVIDTNQRRTLSSKAFVESRCEYSIGTSHSLLCGLADDSNNTYEEDEEAAHMLLKFRKAPLLLQVKSDVVFNSAGQVQNVAFSTNFFNDVDVTYCSTLASRVLENLNQSALLSVFKIPQIGMYTIK